MSMYLAIELQSLSLYVAAAIKRDSISSAESGVKYFILGALSSGILLYGFSLIYGFTGSMNFNEISFYLSKYDNLNLGLIFGLVFVMVGLAFKVSAVPFHMWTPDVYEGAPNSITGFFAIVPKIAVVIPPQLKFSGQAIEKGTWFPIKKYQNRKFIINSKKRKSLNILFYFKKILKDY